MDGDIYVGDGGGDSDVNDGGSTVSALNLRHTKNNCFEQMTHTCTCS